VAFSRARAVDDDPRFVKMIGDLVAERIEPQPAQRAALGSLGIRPDTCPGTCCPGPA
jgi:ferrochelatase